MLQSRVLSTSMATSMAAICNHPPKISYQRAPVTGFPLLKLKKRITCLAAPAPPPSGAAPSGCTHPPEAKPKNKVMTWIKAVNEEFGEIEKFNKLFKSVEAFPIFLNFVFGIITFVQTKKENFLKLKNTAVKYRAYLLGLAVLLIVAKLLSNKKGGDGAPSGDGPAGKNQNN